MSCRQSPSLAGFSETSPGPGHAKFARLQSSTEGSGVIPATRALPGYFSRDFYGEARLVRSDCAGHPAYEAPALCFSTRTSSERNGLLASEACSGPSWDVLTVTSWQLCEDLDLEIPREANTAWDSGLRTGGFRSPTKQVLIVKRHGL